MAIKINHDKIIQAKAELGEKAAEIIANDLQIEDWDSRTLKGRSIFKEENTPSMIWNKKNNSFKDFSSGNNYDIVDHYMNFYGLSFGESVVKLFQETNTDYSTVDFDFAQQHDSMIGYKYPKDEPENDRELVNAYMHKRGISPHTLDYCNVKQSPTGDIAYQFIDTNGSHLCTKYRVAKPASNSKEFKWYWQKGASNCPLLYGADKVDTTKTLVIVEGLNDRLAVVEAGFKNVVSINGGANDYNWISFNYDMLESIQDIIIWSDDDKPGVEMQKECLSRLGMAKVRIVTPDKEVKDKIREYYASYGVEIDKVDANNVLVCCGKDDVLRLINSAKGVENPRLKPLMRYEEMDLNDIPCISTGFKAMDRIITGNFAGGLTVLTAKPGSGKSVFSLTYSVTAPLEAGQKVMVFSGETNASMLLGQVMRPMAGQWHVLEWNNSQYGRPNSYSVTKEAKEAIRGYYMDRLWNYEDVDDMVTDSVSIIETIEYGYKRYGITDFLIDNLMMITFRNADEDNKYASQIEFVMALKRLTRKYGVRICLVCHPRKTQAGQTNIEMSDVAGAAEIVNLSNRAYALTQLRDDPEGYNVEISVLKDRETGKVGQKIKMYFDYPTLRIYSDEEEYNRHYSWEEGFHIDYPEKIKGQIIGNIRRSIEEDFIGK